jgi:hypothetical protein
MPRGRLVYVKGKKEAIGDGMQWPPAKRTEAVTTYLATGTLAMTSAITTVPVRTLRAWKRSAWWKEAIEELMYEDNIKVSAKLDKVLTRSLAAVEDRLENGEYMYDPRTGKIKRIPPKLRDVYKVTSDLVDKKQALLKMHAKEHDTAEKQVIGDHLAQLALAFTKMAGGQVPHPKEFTTSIVEGEYKEVFEELGYEVTEKDGDQELQQVQGNETSP